MSDEKRPQFDYLLNALELAAHSAHPSQEGHGEKRLALFAYVRELERKAVMGDEYAAWIAFWHGGHGDYADFLRKVLSNDDAPGVGGGS